MITDLLARKVVQKSPPKNSDPQTGTIHAVEHEPAAKGNFVALVAWKLDADPESQPRRFHEHRMEELLLLPS